MRAENRSTLFLVPLQSMLPKRASRFSERIVRSENKAE